MRTVLSLRLESGVKWRRGIAECVGCDGRILYTKVWAEYHRSHVYLLNFGDVVTKRLGNKLFDMLTSAGVFDIEEKKSLDTVSPEIDTNQPVKDSAISSDSDAKLEKN